MAEKRIRGDAAAWRARRTDGWKEDGKGGKESVGSKRREGREKEKGENEREKEVKRRNR